MLFILNLYFSSAFFSRIVQSQKKYVNLPLQRISTFRVVIMCGAHQKLRDIKVYTREGCCHYFLTVALMTLDFKKWTEFIDLVH